MSRPSSLNPAQLGSTAEDQKMASVVTEPAPPDRGSLIRLDEGFNASSAGEQAFVRTMFVMPDDETLCALLVLGDKNTVDGAQGNAWYHRAVHADQI